MAFQALSLYFRSGKMPMFSDVQTWLGLFTAVIAAGLMVHYFAIAARKFAAGAKPAL